MSQANWTYYNKLGQVHKIGLYHGDESGHLVLYCNNSIVTIDFYVEEKKKTYSFYINNDLCEVSLNKGIEAYEYDLKINNESAKDIPEPPPAATTTDFVYIGLVGIMFFCIIFSLAAAIS
jgi:hypothetical protein